MMGCNRNDMVISVVIAAVMIVIMITMVVSCCVSGGSGKVIRA